MNNYDRVVTFQNSKMFREIRITNEDSYYGELLEIRGRYKNSLREKSGYNCPI